MDTLPAPCRELAEALATDDPGATLPVMLPNEPLPFLIALHQAALRFVLKDLHRAQRLAALAQCIAGCFPDDPLIQAQAHWTQGSAIAYLPDYAGALRHYDAALANYEEACLLHDPERLPLDVRVVQIPRVFCLTELGRYDEALDAVAAAERWLQEQQAPYPRLTLLLNQSLLAGRRMRDYAQMVTLADATIALAEELDETARIAQGWINRGHACTFLGRFAEAEAALGLGITLAKEAEEPLTVARAQWNCARLLRCQDRLFDALTVLGEARRGLAQAPGEVATVALEEASLYAQLRQLPEAQRAARRAAEQFAQQSMIDYSADAALLAARIAIEQRRAGAAYKQIEFVKAQASQIRSIALKAEIELIEAALTTFPAPDISIRRCRQRQRSARAMAQRAVDRLKTAGLVREAAEGELIVATLNVQIGDKDAAKKIYQRLIASEDRHIRITASAEIGTLLPPSEAIPHLQRAADLSVTQRRALPMEELQARYSSETAPHHMQLAACYLALDAVPQALESVWTGKAGPLLDLRAAAGSLGEAATALLAETRVELARWREEVHHHRRQAWEAAQQGQLEREAYHIEQAEDAAIAMQASELRLTEALRTLGDRGGQAQVPNLTEVQGVMPKRTVLLEYTQVGDQLLSFLVTRGCTPEHHWLGSIAEIEAQHDRWKLVRHRLMTSAPHADIHRQIQTALMPLYERLLAPWRAYLADAMHLLIAPCGVLHHVPWAALYDGTAYLNEWVTVELTPSGALWAARFDPPVASPGPPRLLGYAGSGDRLLAHVEDELYTIAGHFPEAEVQSTATKADLRAFPPPRLLHIAAHAITEPSAPLCSTIELADGLFLLLDAHRLNLQGTDLVTLSACETGMRPDHGDMALALAGAFLCAGAKVVLASLWPVSDAATARLMEHFYTDLAAGALPATALRQAQRAVLVDHPLDWTAFQLWAGAR